jgi:hypothetical protein
MKVKDLLPSAEDSKHLLSIESALLRRRAAGTGAGIFALASAAAQVVFAVADKDYFHKLRDLSWSLLMLRFDELAKAGLDAKTVLTWVVLLVATLLYIALRRTGVLLRDAQEAFRYPFWIEPFVEVEKTPGARFKLAHGDRFCPDAPAQREH